MKHWTSCAIILVHLCSISIENRHEVELLGHEICLCSTAGGIAKVHLTMEQRKPEQT